MLLSQAAEVLFTSCTGKELGFGELRTYKCIILLMLRHYLENVAQVRM